MKFVKSAIAIAAVAVGVLAASSANAALTIGKIPGGTANNDFINKFLPGNSIEGFFGAQLFLVGGPASIKVEYFGAEAGFVNTFTYNGSCTYSNPAGANSFTDNAPAGLGAEDALNFATPCSAAQAANSLLTFSIGGVLNGLNPNGQVSGPGTPANFFVSFDNNYVFDTTINNSTPGGGQSVFLFLDDNGAGPDDNHDDTVIRLSIACQPGVNCGFRIPEPGSLALVGLALFGAGVARRRIS